MLHGAHENVEAFVRNESTNSENKLITEFLTYPLNRHSVCARSNSNVDSIWNDTAFIVERYQFGRGVAIAGRGNNNAAGALHKTINEWIAEATKNLSTKGVSMVRKNHFTGVAAHQKSQCRTGVGHMNMHEIGRGTPDGR
jgi:hypothetical protein